MASAWQLVNPLTPIAWNWIIVLSVVIGLVIFLQDLRDVEGDKAIGRRTFPIVFGDKATRYSLAISFVLLPFVVHFLLVSPLTTATNFWATIGCELLLSAICWLISYRLISFRTAKADHFTYMLFTYWYCFILVTAVILF